MDHNQLGHQDLIMKKGYFINLFACIGYLVVYLRNPTVLLKSIRWKLQMKIFYNVNVISLSFLKYIKVFFNNNSRTNIRMHYWIIYFCYAFSKCFKEADTKFSFMKVCTIKKLTPAYLPRIILNKQLTIYENPLVLLILRKYLLCR